MFLSVICKVGCTDLMQTITLKMKTLASQAIKANSHSPSFSQHIYVLPTTYACYLVLKEMLCLSTIYSPVHFAQWHQLFPGKLDTPSSGCGRLEPSLG